MDQIRMSVPGGTSVITLNVSEVDLARKIQEKHPVILTDENVYFLFKELFADAPVIVIPAGEQEKSLGRAGFLYREMLRLNADRETSLIAVGGGVITDLAGFVATTYMRGMKLTFVPTTLLAMVDAAIGGKNGVNLGEYKNMVGTFRQPEEIWVTRKFLETLPFEYFLSGLTEVVKYGLIHDPVIVDLLSGKDPAGLPSDQPLLEKLITRSIRSKVEIVEQDELDQGVRRILNFGHTFGHAVERVHDLSHGEAVAIGMCVAMELSVRKGLLDSQLGENISDLLIRYGLVPQVSPDPEQVVEAMGKDKKVREGHWYYILLENVGNPVVQTVQPEEYLSFLRDLEKIRFYEKLHSHR